MIEFQVSIKALLSYLSDNNVVEAYRELVSIIQETEQNSELVEQVHGLEGIIADFVSDKVPNSEEAKQADKKKAVKTFRLLKYAIYNILGQCYCHKLSLNRQLDYIFEKGSTVDKKSISDTLSAILTEEAMLHLKSNLSPEQLVEEECALQGKLNDYREKVFYSFLISNLWNGDDRVEMEQILLSPITDEISVQLFVSAITMACLNFFDLEKYLLLSHVYQHASSASVKARALVGLVLCDARMPEFMEADRFSKEVIDLASTDENFKNSLLKVQKWLDISVLSMDVCHDIARQMMGGAVKHLSHMVTGETEEERVKRITSNDEDDEKSEEMKETFDGVVDHEREGYDLYVGQFKEMTKSRFFKSLYNWFMPFDEQNPLLLKFMSETPKGREVITIMHDHTEFCDSDLYGFVYIAQKFPEMLNDLWKQTPEELSKDLREGFKTFGESRLLRNYIRQLYRFYTFANKERIFFDPFKDEQENGSPTYCFLSHPHYEDFLFKDVLRQAEEYALSQGSPKLVLAFCNKKKMKDLTIEEHLAVAEALMPGDDDVEGVTYSDHIEMVLQADPDNLRAHYLIYSDRYASDNEVISSSLFLLKNKDVLLAGSDEALGKFTEEDIFDIKIRLLRAYISTRQLEAALKLAYEMDYNNPGNDKVNACLAYCLLHRNPIMVSSEQIEKVESIIDPFLAEDLRTEIKNAVQNAGENSSFDKLMNSLANIFFKTSQKSYEAECVFEYCKFLCSLSRHEEAEAMDYLLRGLLDVLPRNRKGDTNLMERLLFPHGVEWLSQFGYDKNYVTLLYQRVRFKVLNVEKKVLDLDNANR